LEIQFFPKSYFQTKNPSVPVNKIQKIDSAIHQKLNCQSLAGIKTFMLRTHDRIQTFCEIYQKNPDEIQRNLKAILASHMRI